MSDMAADRMGTDGSRGASAGANGGEPVREARERGAGRGEGAGEAGVGRVDEELRRHALSGVLLRTARVPRLWRRCLALAFRMEGGQYWSASAREIMWRRCAVRIGAYSYGQCFVPHGFPPGTVVGRYVSIADGVNIFLRNHPMDRLSTHPFFFNARMGVVESDNVENNRFVMESDSWIGANAIFTPGCKRVGLGAVVGAGSVVTRDVPDFAVVVGNPAKLIRMRFDEATCEAIRASRWWERPLRECGQVLESMTAPLADWRRHPLLASRRA